MCLALVIEHAKGMRHIVLSSVACLALQYLSSLSPKRHDFLGKKNTNHKMLVLIFSTPVCQTFLILRKIQRDILINVETSSREVPVILARF